MDMSAEEQALWSRVGAGLGHQIFDRYERFEDALDGALAGFSPAECARVRDLLDRMRAKEGDLRAVWQVSGAGIAFKDARGARMTLDTLREAVVTRL